MKKQLGFRTKGQGLEPRARDYSQRSGVRTKGQGLEDITEVEGGAINEES